VEPPTALPAQLYLLAYDLRRQGLTRQRDQLGLVVRAGALEDLRLAGIIEDDQGKVRVRALRQLADPVASAVLREVRDSRPRPWRHWVRVHESQSARAVRDHLDDRRYLRVERRRILGIIPWTTVTARDRNAIQELRDTVLNTLTDRRPAAEIDPHVAALVALAATGELGSVLPRALRRVHKRRIAELVGRVQPTAQALRKAIQSNRAAAASAGG
jgi:hypothetical protein